jgi:release factor glutamine methyltransferase
LPTRTAALDAQLLLAHAVQRDRAWIIAHHDAAVCDAGLHYFARLIERRRAGEPVAYLLGRAHWYDLELEVTPDVLIPRPETELLLERACDVARRCPTRRVADIGTGSGALAIGLARCLPAAQIDAIDISAEALGVAARNVARYGLSSRVALRQGNLIEPLDAAPDLIVANLPYLSDAMMKEISPDVRCEPTTALHAGASGLELYGELWRMLQLRGWSPPLVLEIDPRQERALVDLFQDSHVAIEADYAGRPRVATVAPGDSA